ncbi:MAG: NAD(+) kinase [Gammaproteobacteria bacterium]|nr:NAD(+) kinase [Gammaproteobacteria bacterium]
MGLAFKNIGLIGKYADDQMGDFLNRLITHIRRHEVQVFLDKGTSEFTPIPDIEILDRAAMGKRCDLVIVIGGDGTLLNAARSLVEYDVRLIGINMGRLGFLTDISTDQMEHRIDEVMTGGYVTEERALLSAKIYRDGAEISSNIALNDVVIHKWEEARMLEFDTAINGRFVNSQRADGLIISTPTGSTAYALSGGGPILHPALSVITLVPICPHTLSQRPLVIDMENDVEITISDSGHARARVTCDGQISLGVQPKDRIVITRYENKIKLIHPADYHYFELLRAKLHWG